MEREGALYLLSLRLIPLVPFIAVNLAMGLTRIRTGTFYVVSQIGMLLGTAVYIHAGTQLAHLQSTADILSSDVLGALVLLGLLVGGMPIVAPWLLDKLRQRRALRPWRGQRPKTFDRNVVVIGAGAGGLVSAYIAASAQAQVTLVEAKAMGGDCLNFGCVPSKALIQSAKVAHLARTAASFGVVTNAVSVDWPAVIRRIRAVIASIAPHDSAERYRAMGVDVRQGHATILNPWTVEISSPSNAPQRLTTRSIVIATGAQAIVPAIPGLQEVGFATSDTLWEQLEQCSSIPKRILIVGGGPIGCELAQALARLGAKVTLVESAARVLVREDCEVSSLVEAALAADGVEVLTSHSALRSETPNDSNSQEKTLWLVNDGVAHDKLQKEFALPFDLLLCAAGRRARLNGLGLEALGISTEHTLHTNDYLQTVIPNIFAAGDVAGPYQFTHTAAHQAWYATINALFGDFKRFKVSYHAVPCVTFVAPEVARVGLNEQEAVEQGVAFEVTRFDVADLDRALCDAADPKTPPSGWVKVLTAPGRGKILGVTIVAAHGAEMLAEYVLAMRHGLSLNHVLQTVHTYPTWGEANKYAAGLWRRSHAPRWALELSRRLHDWRRG
jgi:pyruvate/2-oxoglutarate dehydrogenase complex dihydrolipoamide dehydrogenase (E3) component